MVVCTCKTLPPTHLSGYTDHHENTCEWRIEQEQRTVDRSYGSLNAEAIIQQDQGRPSTTYTDDIYHLLRSIADSPHLSPLYLEDFARSVERGLSASSGPGEESFRSEAVRLRDQLSAQKQIEECLRAEIRALQDQLKSELAGRKLYEASVDLRVDRILREQDGK